LPSGASAESEASEASVDVGSLVAEPSMVGSFHFSWTSSTHPHTWQKNSLLVLHHPKKKIKLKIKQPSLTLQPQPTKPQIIAAKDKP
jgi:hypothetical protein